MRRILTLSILLVCLVAQARSDSTPLLAAKETGCRITPECVF